MRNWNSTIINPASSKACVFYRTYEELKLETLNGFRKTLYMVFYRTYEELKPVWKFINNYRLSSFLSYLWGIETPFFACKRELFSLFFIVPMRNWNTVFDTMMEEMDEVFYRTYEELKLTSSCRQISFGNQFFIVPMRNWNSKLNTYPYSQNIRFLSYLWGIETYIQHLIYSIQRHFFYRTYEELKLSRLIALSLLS